MILADTLPKNENITFSLINKVLTKKEVSNIIDAVYRFCGQKETVLFADHIMQIGFKYAAIAGISFGKDDLIIPEEEIKTSQAKWWRRQILHVSTIFSPSTLPHAHTKNQLLRSLTAKKIPAKQKLKFSALHYKDPPRPI
jgi:hypothetical protein